MKQNYKVKNATVDWPHDLVEEVLSCCHYKDEYNRTILVDWPTLITNFESNWEYLKQTLTPREELVITMRFKEGNSLDEIGKHFGVTRERVRQILSKGIRRLSTPSRIRHLLCSEELLSEKDSLIKQINDELLSLKQKLWQIKTNPEAFAQEAGIKTHIRELDLSLRSYNCLMRANKTTINDLIVMTEEDLMKIRNLGRKSCKEVIIKLNSLGYYLKNQVLEPELLEDEDE